MIKVQGLSLGSIPWQRLKKSVKFVRGFQWLTSNPSWEQAWCDPKESTLPYDRHAYRITVTIPENQRQRVTPWLKFVQLSGIPPAMAQQLNAHGDPEHWFLYFGILRPIHFLAIDKNPSRTRDLIIEP